MRFLLAWSAVAAVLVGTAEPAPQAFTVGVLRRDAIVLPFATYDGKNWKNYWPDPTDSVDVPVNVRSVPRKWWGPAGPLDTWQVWAGPQPQTVRVRQPDWFQTFCQKQVGLRTDYQPRQWPPGPDAQPYPKDGLAVSPAHRIDPIERLAPDAPETQSIAAYVNLGFKEKEEAAVARAEVEGAQVFPTRKELEALPITIESLYAAGTERRAYWVESSREYKRDGKCAAVLFGNGWLVVESGKLAYAAFEVEMVPCDRSDVLYMLPLGVIAAPGGDDWIVQWSGWNREQYGIIEIRANTIVNLLGVWGGGC